MRDRTGYTVALVGADGAGKSTIAQRLPAVAGLRARYLYMGVNLEASNAVLPTTWLLLRIKRLRGGRPDMAAGPPASAPSSSRGRVGRELKDALRTANLIAEEWFRQVLVWRAHRQGYVVVCDRHFYADYHAHDIRRQAGRSLARRLHGWMLRRFYPRPDLVIHLDAPPSVLLRRKGEGTLESIAARQAEYRDLEGEVTAFETLDATKDPSAVLADVVELIHAHERRDRDRLRRSPDDPAR